MTNSVRQQVLEAIRDRFAGITAGNPGGDPFPFAFSTVEIGPLADQDQRKRYSIGIVAQKEQEVYTFPFIDCLFNVAIEFRATVNQGDPKPAIVAENLVTVCKRVIDMDKRWGGLAIDTKRIGNEVDLDTYADQSVVGVVFMQIHIRHHELDCRSTDGAFG